MSTCIEKLPHSCGSGDGLQVFHSEQDGYTAYCFACSTYDTDPYHDKPPDYKPVVKPSRSPEEVADELASISSYQCLDLQSRGLLSTYLDYFDVKVGVEQTDGVTPESVYFPAYVDGVKTGYKVRLLKEKRMWSVGSTAGAGLFGWEQAVKSGAKRLLICEGEYDAIALFQVMKENNKLNPQYAAFNPAVVSLPSGAGSALRTITTHISSIMDTFSEVVLCFDMDEAGEKAAAEVLKIIPNAMRAKLPKKDANECLLQGYKKALISAVVFKAKKAKNTSFVYGEEIHEKAMVAAEYGAPYPWEKLTELTRGIRTGETIYIAAAVKMGKSVLLDALAAHLITEVGWKILLVKAEEAVAKTYKMVLSKVAGKIFHDPSIPFDEAAYQAAGKQVEGKLIMLDSYQAITWETLQTDIRKAASEGVKAVFIDPIICLTAGMQAGDANAKLAEIAQGMALLALDLDIVVFLFAHLNNPPKGSKSHELGGKVEANQFAGSRAMIRSCHYAMGLEGNKSEELSEEERNIRKLVILSDREFGVTGSVDLFYDKSTGLFNQIGVQV